MRAVLPPLVGLVLSVVSSFGWQSGDTDATTGFSVDTGRRNDVVSFWHCIYTDSDGYADRMGWTGNYSTCYAGTTSREFQDDVQRRMNFVRALAGLHGDVLVNDGTTVWVDGYYNPPASTLRSTAAQEAAHMMARTKVVSHQPSPAQTCFTSAAGNGSFRSNLAYTFFGPGAIDEYMRETDALGDTIWSDTAGHRRWILYPGATTFATGDTPGAPGVAATNALYCVPTQGELVPVEARFTAWPSPGYFPDGLNTRMWSLSYPGADFTSASVSMTGPGGAISVTIIDRENIGHGEPSIVWQVPASIGASSVAADTSYQVAVTGIQGAGVPDSHSYEVIVMDPETLNEPMQLVGTSAPPVSGAMYGFQKVDFADDHEVDISQLAAAGWTEGAEDNPTPRVIDGTSSGYELRSAYTSYFGDFWNSGSKAFRLAFDAFVNPAVEDQFDLDMELVTGSAAQLSFYYRRGLMALGTALQVETSVDGGLSWQSAGSAVIGTYTGTPDGGFTQKTVSLPVNEQAVRVRFRHKWTNNTPFYAVQVYPTQPVGIFIDDITVSDVQELQSVATLSLGGGASSFWFDSAGIGQTLIAGAHYRLRMRAVMDCHEFPFGPTREVTITGAPMTGFAAWKTYEQPLLAGGFDDDDDGDGLGNGTEYAFYGDPLDPSTSSGYAVLDLQAGFLRLRKPLAELRSDIMYDAEWSPDIVTWSTDGVTVTFAGGELEAEVAMGGAMRFLRWRISQL